jgi:hypothetical protein
MTRPRSRKGGQDGRDGRDGRDGAMDVLLKAMVAAAASGDDNPRKPRPAKPVPEEQDLPLDVNLVRLLEDAVRSADEAASDVSEAYHKVDANYPVSVGPRKEDLLDRLESATLLLANLEEMLSDLATDERRRHAHVTGEMAREDITKIRLERRRRKEGGA